MSLKGRAKNAIANAVHRRDPVKDIDYELERQALVDTAEFVAQNLGHLVGHRGPTAVDAKLALLYEALDLAPAQGLVMEFGVAGGFTLREIASRRPTCFGFDSFEGLPSHWRAGYTKGDFAQDAPEVGTAQLVVGWFDQTLPSFLADHGEPIAFIHMDADLYSSTKTIFDVAFDRFVAGTVILFDEYFNYPNWRQHEHRAFIEFLERYEGGFEYIGYNSMHEQLAVVLT